MGFDFEKNASGVVASLPSVAIQIIREQLEGARNKRIEALERLFEVARNLETESVRTLNIHIRSAEEWGERISMLIELIGLIEQAEEGVKRRLSLTRQQEQT